MTTLGLYGHSDLMNYDEGPVGDHIPEEGHGQQQGAHQRRPVHPGQGSRTHHLLVSAGPGCH